MAGHIADYLELEASILRGYTAARFGHNRTNPIGDPIEPTNKEASKQMQTLASSVRKKMGLHLLLQARTTTSLSLLLINHTLGVGGWIANG